MWAIVVLVYKTAMIIMASSVAVLAHDISGSQPPSVPLWLNASMPPQPMDRNNFKAFKVAGTEHDRLILTASKVEPSGHTAGSAKLTSDDEKEQDLLNYAETVGEAASQCVDEFFAKGQSPQLDCTISDDSRRLNKIETATENDDVFSSAIDRALGWFRESQTTYQKKIVPRLQAGNRVVVLPRDDSKAPQPLQNEASITLSTGDEIVRSLQNWFKTSSVNYDREILQRLAGMDQEREQEEQRRQAEEQKRSQAEAEERRHQAEEQKRLQAEAEERRRQAEEQKRLQAEAEEQPATALTQDRQMTEEFSLSGRGRSQTDDTALQQAKEKPEQQPARTDDQSQRVQSEVDPGEREEDQQFANLPARSEQSDQNQTGRMVSDNDQHTGSKDEAQNVAANRETAIGTGTMPTLPERNTARKTNVASLKTLPPPLPEKNTYMRTASIQNVPSVIPGVPSRNPKLRLAREEENRSSKAGGKSSRTASDNRYKPSMRLTAAGRHRLRRTKPQADCGRSSRRRIKLPGMYVVRPGDTLWHIARRHYRGGWKFWQIYRANRSKIQNPNMIYPCQIFYIPPRR